MPKVYWLSTLKIRYSPEITIKPNKSSKKISLLLKKKGSISDVNNAPVLIATSAMDTFATLIAEKKAIQCTAISVPPTKNFKSPFEVVFKDFF